MSFESKAQTLRNFRGEDREGIRFGTTLPVALAHIIHLFQPFPQHKSNLSLESLYLLSCVSIIPGLFREDSCDICVSYRAIKDVLGLQGHHSSCELSTDYGALVDLIESFESEAFLRRLDIYTIP
jgi:hypothetical protein